MANVYAEWVRVGHLCSSLKICCFSVGGLPPGPPPPRSSAQATPPPPPPKATEPPPKQLSPAPPPPPQATEPPPPPPPPLGMSVNRGVGGGGLRLSQQSPQKIHRNPPKHRRSPFLAAPGGCCRGGVGRKSVCPVRRLQMPFREEQMGKGRERLGHRLGQPCGRTTRAFSPTPPPLSTLGKWGVGERSSSPMPRPPHTSRRASSAWRRTSSRTRST